MEYIKYLSIILILSCVKVTHAGDYLEDIFIQVKEGSFDKASHICIEHNDQEMCKVIKLKEYISDNYNKYTFEEIANFIISNPTWPYEGTLRINAERLINENSNKKLVYVFLSKFYPLTPNGHKYYAYSGSIFVKSEEALSNLIKNGWHYGNFEYKEQLAYKKKFAKYLSPQNDITRAKTLLWDNRVIEAGNMVDNLDEAEQVWIAARIRLQNNIAYYNEVLKQIPRQYTGEYEKNLFAAQLALKHDTDNYQKLISAVPDKYKNEPGLVYDYCCKCRKLDYINAEASNLLIQIPQDMVHANLWWKLKAYFIRENIKNKDYKLGYNIAKNHQACSDADISEGEWLAGWIALRFLKKPELAKQHFIKFITIVQTPISLSRGYYWLGRTYKQLGMKTDATQAFESASNYNYTFYGMLASKECGLTKLSLSQDTEFDNEDISNFAKNWHLNIAKKIVKYDPKLAIEFAKIVISKISDKKKLLAALIYLKTPGMDYFNLEISRIASKKGLLHLETLYPLPIKLKNLKVDHSHTYAVIRYESAFNQYEFDKKANDSGLMQLIPDTACRVSASMNIPCDLESLRTDPDYNILLGTEHLFELNNLYGHSLILTSCAYNAGTTSANRWIKRNGDPRKMSYLYNVIDWIELIPFVTTRNYVQRMIENVQMYKLRISKKHTLEIRELIMGKI